MESTSAGSASTATAQRGPTRPRKQAVLEVTGKTRISPRLLRVTLGGQEYSQLNRNDHTDAYVKLLIADPAAGLQPPYDLDALREQHPDLLPARRTYTVRHWDDEARSLDIDVVLHGDGEDSGVAARWADGALPGDRIALMGAGGDYTPAASTESHLLIGDHASLPAIAASLEAMDPSATGVALIHLDHDEDQLDLPHPAGIELRWVIGAREQLLEEVSALDLSVPERFGVFCHAERGLTKQLRRILVKEAGIPREQVSISAYWALGRIEDQFQAEKREPIGAIDD
ncbi:siderophore-interacting protein [Brachybacterium sp. GCM10030267]|uniref:siderophore-interacting protein n=1 Tax=unclassified Brachybacterium TaxID=2623841 RepID=UPI0036086EE2